MPTDFAPRETASGGKRRSVKNKRKLAAFSGRSFGSGAACGALVTLVLVYGPALTRAAFDDGDPAPATQTPAQPDLTYEFIRRLPNDEVVTNVTPYQPPELAPSEQAASVDAEAAQTDAVPVPVVEEGGDGTELAQAGETAFSAGDALPERSASVSAEAAQTGAVPTAKAGGDGTELAQAGGTAFSAGEGADALPKRSASIDAEAASTGAVPAAKAASDGVKVAQADAPPVAPNTAKEHFVLQAATFRSRDAADALRAELILEGLGKVAVNTVARSDDGAAYRVLVGPLPKQELERAQAALRAKDMAPLLVENATSGQ